MKAKINCSNCRDNETEAFYHAGGLAVTGMHLPDCDFSDRYFTVTHIGTGRKLASSLQLLQAKRLLDRLLEITDWRRPGIYEECAAQNSAWVLNAKQLIRELVGGDS